MKLTIDTQVDTHEDIRKVLQILTSILEKKDPLSSSTYPQHSADPVNLMSMFSDEQAVMDGQKGSLETKGNAPDFSSFLNLTSSQKKEGKDDNEPKVEYY